MNKKQVKEVEVCLHCGRMKQRWWETVLLVRTDIPTKKTHMNTNTLRDRTSVKTIAVSVDSALSFFKSSVASSS